ncbi:ERF superfamily protein [Sphingomonas sp. F9_3S_D5_B_2]
MAAPSVYGAITAITGDFAQLGIAKSHRNEIDQYLYRSIDDVLNRLSPLLAKHRLCVLPRVIDRVVTDRDGPGEALLVNVALRVVYAIVSADDGSSHEVESFGEALDSGDKATAKAMSSAYKIAMLQTFCIPVTDVEEPDAQSPRISRRTHGPEPVQGWDSWVTDIGEIVRICESEEAISRVQQRHRALLQAVSRERADLYAALGEVFRTRRAELKRPDPRNRTKDKRTAPAGRKGMKGEEELARA